MASRSRVPTSLTLEEFLRRPDSAWPGGKRHLEYVDGRVGAKALPQGKHSLLTVRFTSRLNEHAEPRRLGLALVDLRCTFGGRSIIPDIAFFLEEHIQCDRSGEIANSFRRAPDLHVEIISPEQSVRKATAKLIHSTTHGCPLALLIHPKRKTIDEFRPGQPPTRLAPDGVIDGAPVLPGFRLPVAEVFGWLQRRRSESHAPNGGAPPA